jgi:23S rRNA G2445 N2-methylase RlmL
MLDRTKKAPITVTAPKGLPRCTAKEIRDLGYPIRSVSSSGVHTFGDIRDCMRMVLHLRTAHHVLYRLSRFTCRNADELYRAAGKLPWEEIIPADGYLSVVSHVVNPTIRDARYANVRCKDAIVDRIMARKGRRPDSGPLKTGCVVTVYWMEEECSLYLDMAGEPLSKRGYRMLPLDAPMQETLAAGVVLASRYDGSGVFINPMCGSGTLAIEAAMVASGKPPGSIRQSHAFMHLLGFDRKEWEKLLNEPPLQKPSGRVNIIATDIRTDAVDAARKNAAAAGVASLIQFKTGDFAATRVPQYTGVIVVNPEYGIRMGDESTLRDLYKKLGAFFTLHRAGYSSFLFTANQHLADQTGLKPDRETVFYSGKIKCTLYEYRYRGTSADSQR